MRLCVAWTWTESVTSVKMNLDSSKWLALLPMGPLPTDTDYDGSVTNTDAEILTSESLGWRGPSLLFLTSCNLIFTPSPPHSSYYTNALKLCHIPWPISLCKKEKKKKKKCENVGLFPIAFCEGHVTVFPRDVKVYLFRGKNRKHQIPLTFILSLSLHI